jgi:hypothetical protein
MIYFRIFALSTVSSCLNALATVTLEDVVKKRWTDLSDYEATKVSKILGELTMHYVETYLYIYLDVKTFMSGEYTDTQKYRL